MQYGKNSNGLGKLLFLVIVYMLFALLIIFIFVVGPAVIGLSCCGRPTIKFVDVFVIYVCVLLCMCVCFVQCVVYLMEKQLN